MDWSVTHGAGTSITAAQHLTKLWSAVTEDNKGWNRIGCMKAQVVAIETDGIYSGHKRC